MVVLRGTTIVVLRGTTIVVQLSDLNSSIILFKVGQLVAVPMGTTMVAQLSDLFLGHTPSRLGNESSFPS